MNFAPNLDFTQCLLPADQASSLPPSCYTSAGVVQSEVETIFRQSWIGVGRADMVPKSGNYITLNFAEQQIILLRDTKGSCVHLQMFVDIAVRGCSMVRVIAKGSGARFIHGFMG